MLLNHENNGRLIPGEPESINVSATYVIGQGWHCTILVRRQFQEWNQASKGVYALLSTPELVTLIDAALSSELKV